MIFPDDQPDYADRVVDIDAVHAAKQQARIPVFIILDGTWRQARRMFRKSPYLDALPVLPLRTERGPATGCASPPRKRICAPPR